ncbi:hypothetical protein [Nocardia sp. NPDC052112]|uniref:hypothetical protein n=1 Tax=Nocardia sp. NPDC052112 TaxID=3155646 RepID=UPI00341ED669
MDELDALRWVRSHGYNIFVHDLVELGHMIRLGCYTEAELHTRAKEMAARCLMQRVADKAEDDLCDLIDSAFESNVDLNDPDDNC